MTFNDFHPLLNRSERMIKFVEGTNVTDMAG